MDRLTAMQAFVRLVERGSFSQVAEELHVKQSTVSKWLAQLESQLSAQLIERTTRTHRVTEAGHLFYDRAKDILSAYDEATAQLAATAPDPRGRIRVSAPVVFGRRYLVPHLARYLKKHPHLELELVMSDRYVNLIEERFDVALRVGAPEDSSFRARKLGASTRHLVASPGYLQAHGTPESPKDLKHHSCLLHTGLSKRDPWVFYRFERAIRTSVQGRFAANHSEALLALAKGGAGVALLARWLVASELKSGRLVALLPEYDLPPAPIYALMPPTRHVHPRVRSFINFLTEILDRFAEEDELR